MTDHTLFTADPDRSRRTLRKVGRGLAVLLLLLLLGAAARFLVQGRQSAALAERTRNGLERSVIVTRAHPGELKRSATLPATLRGVTETPIYARSNGYLAAWHKTIGDRVKKGELLATIDAPEQDQELAQARAARDQAAARADLARLTQERWESLRRHDGVSQQDLEEKRSALVQARADLAAADANVRRLEELQSFRRITAPFAGVITRRSVDVGNLVGAGTKELFALAQTDPLRLTVWVPQAYAGTVKVGAEAGVAVAELAGKRFPATVENVAGGLDPTTKALQVDVRLPNPDGRLLPGAYAEVTLALAGGVPALVVPSSVLMIRADGPRVAVVDEGGRIAFRPVRLGRDLGRETEIVEGITAEDTLVVSPSDLLEQGERVRTVPLAPARNESKNGAGTGKP